ncbi:hypothetical protein [Xanthomonas arboricola]|uniref:hypothetical protein n=1 Tax=Xanthomonas arboricola TaxID=56448 RepID=UPI0015CB1C64
MQKVPVFVSGASGVIVDLRRMPHCLLVSVCFGGIEVARKQLMLSNNVGALQKHFLPTQTYT